MTAADITALGERAVAAILAASTPQALEEAEVQYVGRKGELTAILRGIKDLPLEERGAVGGTANKTRLAIEAALSEKREAFASAAGPAVDVTLPGRTPLVGHLHIVPEGIRTIARIFEEIGFEIVSREEVESDWFAFEALNMPSDHPARDEWETFFMEYRDPAEKERFLLTPHATSGTARLLAERTPPIRVLNVQKTYRRQIDASHTPMFHQFDGVWVDTGVTIRHLKGMFEYFVASFFGKDRTIRYRPYHFRFVEPGLEIDINCAVCDGRGCKLCKEGWVELGGAGMLHPNVLKAANLDPKKYSALAFGWGVERNVVMRSGLDIPDIRLLYENDVRFLEQF